MLALRPEDEHPGLVILVRRRARQAEIAAMQKLPTGAGKHLMGVTTLAERSNG